MTPDHGTLEAMRRRIGWRLAPVDSAPLIASLLHRVLVATHTRDRPRAGVRWPRMRTRCVRRQDGAAVADAISRYREGGVGLHDCLIVSLAARRAARTPTLDAGASRRLGLELLK